MSSAKSAGRLKEARKGSECRVVHLPVVESPHADSARKPPRARSSRIGKWRAGILIGIHLAMVAHIVHWSLTGRSLGRFVLSDSMRTLEVGEINLGFLLFVASLLVTACLGRFMCGWVCHMGALQDLCGWLLRRAGLRPRLFRSRFLGLVPLALAIYMFVWPTFNREVFHPRLSPLLPRVAGSPEPAPFPGLSTDFMTQELWDGLPSWVVAIPFLLLCGFGTVYFLGARGLCRYGCPYGGFLLPAEQLAIGRVTVDMNRCDQCGLCTAACTAGVRVHDEVRLFGAVMDRNCVRSLDCVGACPQRALRFSFARPALLHRSHHNEPRPHRPDLSLGEEVLCTVVFAATFFVSRGLYDLIPMLMAATMGVLAAFGTWKTVRVFRDANVRLGPLQLRHRGVLTLAGKGFLVGGVLTFLLWANSAVVRGILWKAAREDDRVQVSYEDVVRGGGTEADRQAAARAERLYSLAKPLWRGGLGLAVTPAAEFRRAWAQVVAGDHDAAIDTLGCLTHGSRPSPHAVTQLCRILLSDGRSAEATARLRKAVDKHPKWAPPRDMLATLLLRAGASEEAEQLYRDALVGLPTDASARTGLGRLLLALGRGDDGIAELRVVSNLWPRQTDARRDLAIALFHAGRVDEALAELDAAGRVRPASREALSQLAKQMRQAAGK